MNFKLSDLKLVNNSELYIYNSNGTVIIGPVTYKENSTAEFNSMGTDLIEGDEAIIQIIEPKSSTQKPTVRITNVVHGFVNHYKEILPSNNKNINNFQAATLTCHNDVMCHPDFENYSKGVALIMIRTQYWCSGALLNNTVGSNRPFFLTAFHCADGDKNGALTSEKSYTETWNFKFNYKKICNSNSLVSYVYETYSGCHFRSAWKDTDFLLLELKDAITDSNIRFLGWDIVGANPTNKYATVGIHHPGGDPMKISFRDGWVFSNGDHFTSGSVYYPRNHFWNVIFTNSAIEGGSSGSLLLSKFSSSEEYRVIGQAGFVNKEVCPPDQRGRLTESWEGGGVNNTRLDVWLNSFNNLKWQTNTIGSCQSFNLSDKTITEDERIVCKNINVQNVTVNSGKKLILESVSGSITIGPNVTVKSGATLEINADNSSVVIDYGSFIVEPESIFIVK